MADSTTSNLLLTKPEVGASTDTWGGKINTDLDTIDALFTANGTGTSVGLNVGAGKTLKVAGTTDFSANLTFTGTGNRITGDFSNATIASRVMFQSSTTNAQTQILAIPNGTSTQAVFEANSDSSGGTNAVIGQIGVISGAEVRITSGIRGTGTYQPMTLHTGGSERVRIDTSGNVGIGTSSPGNKLSVVGDQRITLTTAGTSYPLILGNETASGVSAAAIAFQNGGSTKASIQAAVYGNDYMTFNVGSNTERMRIDSSGNLLVGTTGLGTGTGHGLSPTGTGYSLRPSGAAQSMWLWYNGGSVVGEIRTSTTATQYLTSSDYRLKEAVAPMVGALAKVQQLKPVTYKWKLDGSDGQGFIAHELQEVVPECVTGEKDAVDAEGNPQYQGIDTSFLVATLTAAIQELKALVDTQASTITTLTDRITALEAK
jgi:hypothetical protein